MRRPPRWVRQAHGPYCIDGLGMTTGSVLGTRRVLLNAWILTAITGVGGLAFAGLAIHDFVGGIDQRGALAGGVTGGTSASTVVAVRMLRRFADPRCCSRFDHRMSLPPWWSQSRSEVPRTTFGQGRGRRRRARGGHRSTPTLLLAPVMVMTSVNSPHEHRRAAHARSSGPVRGRR